MTNPQIKFKCPECEHDQLVQVMEQVMVTDRLKGFFVATTGRKYSAETNFQAVGRGKIKQFQCSRCGHILMAQPRRLGWWAQQQGKKAPVPKPITSTYAVYLWLKRNGMIKAAAG